MFINATTRPKGNIEISSQNIVGGTSFVYDLGLQKYLVLERIAHFFDAIRRYFYTEAKDRKVFLRSAQPVVFLLLLASNTSWDRFLAFKFRGYSPAGDGDVTVVKGMCYWWGTR